jgi:transcriptional regulator
MPANDRLQGTLDLLVLKTLLARGPLHGYGITTVIEEASSEILQVEEGSLYPALHRMEKEGSIESEWGTTDTNRRARFYRITAGGRKRLKQEEESWARVTEAVSRVLKLA